MFFVLVLLFLVLCSGQVKAQSFNYQFALLDNTFNFELFRSLDLSIPAQVSPIPAAKNYFTFEYKLKPLLDLPLDLPLFLVTSDKKVLFTADAAWADDQFHQVQVKLSTPGELPIFYQNNYLTGFELNFRNLSFTAEQVKNDIEPIKFSDLNVIREADQSLTILFSVQDEGEMARVYRLICADKPQIFSDLSKNDDFLWPNFLFTALHSNQQRELIFHLSEFSCRGNVYVADAFGNQSAKSSIVGINEL